MRRGHAINAVAGRGGDALIDLAPMEVAYDAARGRAIPLPPELAAVYGRLIFPDTGRRPYVFVNFVTSLDGVVALDAEGRSGGGDISGGNRHDVMLMGLLRACADVVVVGAGTLRSAPRHLWLPEAIYPAGGDAFRQVRTALRKPRPPMTVIVTARGDVNLSWPVFQADDPPSLLVTTEEGERRLRAQQKRTPSRITAISGVNKVGVAEILGAIEAAGGGHDVLSEAGPRLLTDFLEARAVDDLFLTLAPQVIGRDGSVERPGLANGRLFAPRDPRWATLVSIRRVESFLFLRYRFRDP